MPAEITLTKQAAAQRLITSAVRMADSGLDDLATHVVAASAVSLLRELLIAQGKDLATPALQYSFYAQAIARQNGNLTGFENEPQIAEIVDAICRGIEDGTISRPSDIKMSIPDGDDRRFLDPIIRPFNYLKHAQRDPLATLDQADVVPLEAIRTAISAYLFLLPGQTLSDEISAFCSKQGWVT